MTVESVTRSPSSSVPCDSVVIARKCAAGPEDARQGAEEKYGMESGRFTSYELCKRPTLPSHHETVRIGTCVRVDETHVGVVCQLLRKGTHGWLKIRLLQQNSRRTQEPPLSSVQRLDLTDTFQFVPAALDLPFLHVVHDCKPPGSGRSCRLAPPPARGQPRPHSFTRDPFRCHNTANKKFWLNPFFVD